MSQLEAMSRSVSDCCSLSSSGTILWEHRPPSSSRCSRITCPQPIVTMARTLSFSHVLFDRPFQIPLPTHDAINYDMVISLPSSLGVSATPTSSLSSLFAANSRTTSSVVAIRRDDDDDDDDDDDYDDGNGDVAVVAAASSVSFATPVTVSVMMTITSEWGYTTVTLGSTSTGSFQPSSTGPVAPALSTSKSSLYPLILELIFGLVFLIALVVIIHRFYSRRCRQAELLSQPLPGHGNHNYRKWLPRDPTPLVATPTTLERYPRVPPLVRRVSGWRSRYHSQGDSSETISEAFFADGSFAVSSRTSEPAPNNHLISGASIGTLHSSDNSELNILAPIPSNAGTSVDSSYFSPSGHYRDRRAPPATLAEESSGFSRW